MPDNNELKNLIKILGEKIDKQSQKINSIKNRLENVEKLAIKEKLSSATPPPPPLPPSAPTVHINKETKESIAIGVDKNILEKTDNRSEQADEQSAILTSKTVSTEKKSFSQWEEVVGGQLFLKIGIIAFVLGITFLLKYAFDNNWIGPTGRVLIGIFSGLALLGIGEKTIRKYFLYGQILSGGGLTLLYLSIYAALNFYHLVSPSVAFIGMALITIVGIALSLRYNAPSLIIYATIGGFVTPFLVSTGGNHQFLLFSYITILDLAILVVSVFKQWRWLNVIGFVSTFFIFLSWHSVFYTSEQLAPTLFFATIFFVIYSISSLVYNLIKKELSVGFEQAITLFTGLVYFAYVYALLAEKFDFMQGIFVTFLALYYFLWAYVVREITPRDDDLYNFLAFLSVAFITIALAVQFKDYIVTMSWTIEAVLLLILASGLKSSSARPLKYFGLSILFFALLRVLGSDAKSYTNDSWFLLNPVFLSALLLIVGLYISAFFFTRQEENNEDRLGRYNKTLIAAMLIVASFLTFMVVPRDIEHYYQTKINTVRQRISRENYAIRQQYGNRHEIMKKIDTKFLKKNNNRKNTAIALFTLIYAIILWAISIFRVYRPLLWTALAGLAIAEFNIFFGLIFILDFPWRQISSISGIAAPYITALFALSLKEKDNDSFVFVRKTLIVFLLAASFFTILTGTREISAHYEKNIAMQKKIINKLCSSGVPPIKQFNSYSNQINNTKQVNALACKDARTTLKGLRSRASTAISIFWLLYAIILLVIGFSRRNTWVRLGGILLLLIAVFKLFFIDLWSLGQLYRIIASISLGVVLLSISFVYQKYKHRLKELLTD